MSINLPNWYCSTLHIYPVFVAQTYKPIVHLALFSYITRDIKGKPKARYNNTDSITYWSLCRSAHISECLISKAFQWLLCKADPTKLFSREFQRTSIWIIQNGSVNTLRPRQNGRHFADDILKCIFLNKNVWIPIEISLNFVPKGPIDNIPALV